MIKQSHKSLVLITPPGLQKPLSKMLIVFTEEGEAGAAGAAGAVATSRCTEPSSDRGLIVDAEVVVITQRSDKESGLYLQSQ